jgi:hypothetical protein
MLRFLFVLVIGLCFSWNTAKAQENHELPQKNQQNWAFPDCSAPVRAVFLTGDLRLEASKEALSLLPSKAAALDTFKPCAKTPKIIPPEMHRLLRFISRVQKKCTLSNSDSCLRVGFKMADDNNDKKLTAAEISKAVAAVFLFAELVEKESIGRQTAKDIIDDAKKAGPALAKEIIGAYDADKSGTLDYNEMTTEAEAPRNPKIKETLKKMGKIIQLFKVAAAAL